MARGRGADVRWAEMAAFAFALALSAYMVVLVRGQAGSVAACAAATAMTLPVAFARRAPLAAAAVLAAAAAANELFFGHLVRCGAALPAVFFVAYLAGRFCAGRGRALVLAGVLVSVVIQCLYDPRLGAPVIALMAVVSGVFAGAGVLVRRRAGLVAELRRRTEQLREQRERTAALAVAAERARITADISGTLRERIDEIGRLARPAGDGTDHSMRASPRSSWPAGRSSTPCATWWARSAMRPGSPSPAWLSWAACSRPRLRRPPGCQSRGRRGRCRRASS